MPAQFPINGLQAARAFYWLEGSSPQQAKPFARAIFAAYFVDGRDISNREVVADVGGEMGVDRAKLLASIEAPEVKNRLREVTDDAIQRRQVFGSPFIFVDNEPFWGSDRLDMIERWLATGGW
jgi:2-hydroxychromene-2-carboxylate isomerase